MHCARMSATITQARFGVPQLVGDRAEADLGELADEQVRREDHERHQQDVPQANAAKRRHSGFGVPVAAAASSGAP